MRWSKRENTALSEGDREEYMQVGNRQHVRDLKNNMLRRGDSPVLYTESEIKAFIQRSLNIDTYDEILDVLTRKDGSTRAYLGKESENGNVVILELVSKGRQSMQPVTAWQNTKENYQLIWGQKKKAANTSRASQSDAESGYKATINKNIPQAAAESDTKYSMRERDDKHALIIQKNPAISTIAGFSLNGRSAEI